MEGKDCLHFVKRKLCDKRVFTLLRQRFNKLHFAAITAASLWKVCVCQVKPSTDWKKRACEHTFQSFTLNLNWI